MGDLKDIAVLFLVFGGGFWVLAPLARAISKRIAATPDTGDSRTREEIRDELRQVRQEASDLAERMDFTERALAQQKATQRLGPPA